MIVRTSRVKVGHRQAATAGAVLLKFSTRHGWRHSTEPRQALARLP